MIGMPPIVGPSIGPIHDGASFPVPAAHSGLPVGLVANGEFTLRFGFYYATISGKKIIPLGGSEIVPTLIMLANLVEGLIHDFSALG